MSQERYKELNLNPGLAWERTVDFLRRRPGLA
jgi:hypothetical protein